MSDSKAGPKQWWGLAVLGLPTMMTSIDLFVLLLALPHIGAALNTDGVGQLWITDIYGFLLGSCMITMGTLGDRIGRRRLLLIGSAAFGLASIAAAFSNTLWMLIAARAVLGLAGATLAPSALSLISHMFTDERQRAVGIGVWLACLMGGAALGPLIGGLLLQHFWWGSVFLIGVPPMVLLLIVGPFLVPEYRAPNPGRLHWPSAVLSLAAILTFVYGIKELARGGWQPWTMAALAAGVVMGVFFVVQQRRAADPLLDVGLFRKPSFSVVMAGMFLNTMLPGGTMVLITQYLQTVAGLSPWQAGLWMLPAIAASLVVFQVSPRLARFIPPGPLIAGGLVLTVAGLIVLAMVGPDDVARVIIGFILFNLGAGPLVTLGTNLVIGSAPPERAGSAAALSQTGNELGFAIGIAVIGSIAVASGGLLEGLHRAAIISAVVLAAAAVVLAITLRKLKPLGQPQQKD
jgi:DHA2 family multidrug resistance protein-like MFS transporter